MDQLLKKKIGQLLIAGFPSAGVDVQVMRLASDFSVGNFVLFARNIQSAEQLVNLCADLSRLVYDQTGFAPFLAADQEGGIVTRVQVGASLMPGAMAIAASGTGQCRQLAEYNGKIIRAMGLNMTFAPVLDVNMEPMNPIIGTRAFGDDPQRVAELGVPMALGFQDALVLPTVKHFPGHGNVVTDSHLGLPINRSHKDRLEETEWLPFQKAFDQGADGLMTCHVIYPEVDPHWPATLSYEIMTNLLRKKMRFDGLAVTDCLEMDAIRAGYGIGEGAVRALEAGCDMLTFSHTYEAVSEAVNAIYAALESGRLTAERIDRSYQRVLRCKQKYGLLSPPTLQAAAAHKEAFDPVKVALNRQVSADSMTLVSGSLEALHTAKKPAFFAPLSYATTGVEDRERRPVSFSEMAAMRFGGKAVVIPMNDLDAATQSALEGDHDVAVLGLYNARFREGQQAVLHTLESSDRPLIILLLGAPYDISLVQRCDGLVAAHEYTELSVSALLDALETNQFPGNLPIRIHS